MITYPGEFYNYGNLWSGYSRPAGDLIIPDSVMYNGVLYPVVYISDKAFFGCNGLTSINIPNGVKSIGDEAFSGCSGLTSINIPDGVTSISSSAFKNCSGLTSINIPDGVTYIGNNAFYGCSGLSSINIPDSVTSIGGSAFYGCSGLSSINIPDSVTYIYSSAFYGCSGLTSINIPEGITSIADYTFYGCSGLSSINIPDGVTSIGDYAFYGCSGLSSINIPDGVTSIGDYAFYGCSGLSSINIPDGVTTIGSNAFSTCSGFVSISVAAGNANYDSRDNCNAIINTATNQLLWGCESTVIPSNITSIAEYAFYNCHNLPITTIPSNVTSIGYNAFYHVKLIYYSGTATGTPWGALCVNGYQRDSIYYVNSSKQAVIGAHPKIVNPVLPASVTSIGNYAFEGCDSIRTLTIPAAVTIINAGAFRNCSNLTTLNYTATNCTSISRGDIPMSGNIYVDYNAFGGSTNITTLNIGNNVTRIPDYAFLNCKGLKSVSIPDGVFSIGYNAFSGCDSLAIVSLPGSLTLVKSGAFSACDNLTRVNFTGAVGDWCNIIFVDTNANPLIRTHNLYINNEEVTYFDIPDTIISIGQYAFYNCQSLAGTLIIPSSVTSIGRQAFNGCTGLTDVQFNASNCTTADRYYNGSSYSTNGTNSPFTGCTGITAIIVGNNVTKIPDYLFKDCNNVASIIANRTTPPTTYSHSFTNIPQYIPVHVPCGSMMNYYNSSYWSYFSNIDDNCDVAIITATVNNPAWGTVSGGGEYAVGTSVQLNAIPYAGYLFEHWSTGSTTNPLTVTASTNMTYTAVFSIAPIIDTINVYDTTFVDVTVYDTVPVFDTIIVFDTADVPVIVYDTTIVPVIVYDTTIVPVTTYDTTIVPVTEYDTTIVPLTVYDTTLIPVTQFDTVVVPVTEYDTTIVPITTYDTTLVPVTVFDSTLAPIHDTIDNYIHDTVTVTDTLWLTQYDTILIHDTIIIHDTIVVGVDDVETINAKIYTNQGQIVVEGVDGNNVWFYDVNGRVLATKRDEYAPLRFDAPASGTYMIKIGNYPAKKVVVIR